MKKSLSIILLGLLALTGSAKKYTLFVGTNNGGATEGIFSYTFDSSTGDLQVLSKPVVSDNPMFLCISKDNKFLYAGNEINNFDEKGSGAVSAFRIVKDGQLELLNQVSTQSPGTCHVTLSPNGKTLVASNYTGGSITIFPVRSDGKLGEATQLIQHEGNGPVKDRQDAPHAHSSLFDASGKYLFSADLGIDELKIYRFSDEGIHIEPGQMPFVKMAPGAGPRHFDFSNDGRFIYVINELDETMVVLEKDKQGFKIIQVVSTLPEDFSGESFCADVHLSPDNRFVYGSNRGHNSIVVFSRDPRTGILNPIQYAPVEGNWPRNFTLTPDGGYLLVANQKSNNITIFKIDKTSGKITYTGKQVQLLAPVCLKFLN
jgi:6-phosphogluconolactonase